MAPNLRQKVENTSIKNTLGHRNVAWSETPQCNLLHLLPSNHTRARSPRKCLTIQETEDRRSHRTEEIKVNGRTSHLHVVDVMPGACVSRTRQQPPTIRPVFGSLHTNTHLMLDEP